MQPLFEHRLKVAGYETRALELEGNGPPLVLFHGYGDSADTWRLLLDRLGRADRRAIAVDLPGFGMASPLKRGAILPQFDAFSRELIELVAAESGPVVVSGNSLGGVVSLRAVQQRGLPVRGAVPIAPAGLDHPRWFDIIESQAVLGTVLSLPFPVPAVVLREMVGQVYRRLAFAGGTHVEPEVIAAFTQHHASRARVSTLLATGRRLRSELGTPPFEFERIKCPVLLVWGTRDRMVSHSGAEVLTAALPKTRVELLEGIGHCPQIEVPDRVLELLLEFVEAPALAA